jgi:hypothetical protein
MPILFRHPHWAQHAGPIRDYVICGGIPVIVCQETTQTVICAQNGIENTTHTFAPLLGPGLPALAVYDRL